MPNSINGIEWEYERGIKGEPDVVRIRVNSRSELTIAAEVLHGISDAVAGLQESEADSD